MALTMNTFGVSNNLIGSYIEREDVDGEFKRAIELKKQIIVYGSSKQGKTSLLTKHLTFGSSIIIQCCPTTDLIDIYSSVLRQSNITLISQKTKESGSSNKIEPSLKGNLEIPFVAKVDLGMGGDYSTFSNEGEESKQIGYNLNLAQDVCEILKKNNFNKLIILDNFHYLSEEVQKRFAFDLRTFQERDIRFIILGIWRERNRLSQYNGDLQDRVIEVAVEPWSKNDFIKIIELGSKNLNVDFKEIINSLLDSCFDSVGVLQELCKECCLAAKVRETAIVKIKITKNHLDIAINKKLGDYSSRHIKSFESFVEPPRKKRSDAIPLFIPYYFIKILIEEDFENITRGFKRDYLHEKLIRIHHKTEGQEIRASDLSYFLRNLTKSQIDKSIIPPLFDYDRSINTLKIIDSTLYFFLRNCNSKEIFEGIPVPFEDDFDEDITLS